MNTPAHFENGNSIEMSNHLTVTSTTEYSIQVSADQSTLSSTNSNSVDVSNIEISSTHADYVGTPVVLSTTPQNIATSTSGIIGEQYNITYSISSTNAYAFLDLGNDTLTTIITYEIIPN